MLDISLIVLVIGQSAAAPSTLAFQRAVRGVLGREASVQVQVVAEDPPDEQSAARAQNADGLVELSWASDGTRARLHCFLTKEQRWVDREIGFGAGTASPEREASERGRLLGFAVATMFSDELQLEPSTEPESEEPSTPPTSAKPTPPPPPAVESAPAAKPPPPVERGAPARDEAEPASANRARLSLEFAGTGSAGLGGTANGFGAIAGLRYGLAGPLWGRLFVAGRGGTINRAQATTRTALLGGGLALQLLPDSSNFALGLRLDAFACYLEASHFSEDDREPVELSRWLPGGNLIAEAGIRLTGSTGLFAGGGLEALLGRTDVYTHGTLVAVLPPLRLVGEFGFRTRL